MSSVAASTRMSPTWVPVRPDPVGQGPMVYGILETPSSGSVSSAVLIVSPIGREQVVSSFALTALRRSMASRGAVVLQIWLRGEADSHPAGEDVRQEWQEDVVAGLEDLLRRAPGVPLRAVGLRIGAAALLDAMGEEAPERSHRRPVPMPERAVLWEPVAGRAYLRRASSLRRLSVPREVVDTVQGVETAGCLWTPGQAASLRELPDPLKVPTLPEGWVQRVEPHRDVAEVLWGAGSEFARVPREAVNAIAQQLTHSSGPALPVDDHPLTTACWGLGAARIREQLVRVGDGRPAVLSMPCGGVGASTTAVQLVAAASEPADGPTGLWAQEARSLAAGGLTVLRAERPGCGPMMVPDTEVPPMPYDAASVEAVRRDARWLARRTGLPVTGVGLCVGAWLVLRAAEPQITHRVIAVNNVAWRRRTGYYRLMYSEMGTWEGAPAAITSDGRASAESAGARLFVQGCLRRLLGRARAVSESCAPAGLWHVLGLLGLANSVSVLLTASSRPGQIDLVLGREDEEAFLRDRGPWALRRARRGGTQVRVHAVPQLDHALLSADGRDHARRVLRTLLLDTGRSAEGAEVARVGDLESPACGAPVENLRPSDSHPHPLLGASSRDASEPLHIPWPSRKLP